MRTADVMIGEFWDWLRCYEKPGYVSEEDLVEAAGDVLNTLEEVERLLDGEETG